MIRKRSRLEMYLDVLEKISQGVGRPTKIMYKCNLSWRPLQEILRSLIERGLIEEIEQCNYRYYIVKKKGEETLIYLRRLIRMLHSSRREEAILPSSKQSLPITINLLKSSATFNSQKRDKKEDD